MSARAGPTATSRVEGWLISAERPGPPAVSGSNAARSGSAYGRDQSVCRGAAALSRCARAVVRAVTGSEVAVLPCVGGCELPVGGGDWVAEGSTVRGVGLGPRIAGSIAQVTFAFWVPWISLSTREPGPTALVQAAVRAGLAIL